MEYTRYYRLLTVEKKDLELDLKALGVPSMFRSAVSATAQKHLQLALDRPRQGLADCDGTRRDRSREGWFDPSRTCTGRHHR